MRGLVRSAAVCVAMALATRAASAAGLGDVSAVNHDADSVTLNVGADTLTVRVMGPQIVRVDYRKDGKTDPATPVADPNPTPLPTHATIKADGDPVEIGTDRFTVRISKSPCRLTLLDGAGKRLLSEPADGGVYVDPKSDGRGGLRFMQTAGKPFYGVKAYDIGGSFREPATLVRGGLAGDSHTFTANASTQGGAGSPLIWTTGGFGLLVDSDNGFFTANDQALAFDYGTPSPENNGRRYDRPNDVTYFLIVGSPKDIMAGVAVASGRPPMFPKWAMGFTNSQWGINQDMAITAIDTYRAKDIPIDNFTFDFDWKAWGEDDFGEFRWNLDKFPSASPDQRQPFIAKMQARGMHVTGIMKPRIVRYLDKAAKGPQTKQGEEADRLGYWAPGVPMHRDYQSGMPSGELDFDRQDVRDWFWANVKKYGSMESGISGFWNDEADETGLDKGGRVVFSNTNHLGMQQSLYEGQRAYTDNGRVPQRVWSINRNFYLGAQRYAYGLWSGDINTGFESMAKQAGRMLTAVSLGEQKWGMDTGGFNGTPSPENYARWMQFASVVPIFRVHGTIQEHRQPWVYGEHAETIATEAVRRRYRFTPYVYAAEREAYEGGFGVVRPLMAAFPDDAASADVTDEWMFGPDLLAAPVLAQGATSRSIYLPPGTWIDYNRGDTIQGGKKIDYPVDAKAWTDLPLFVRSGAIVPTQDLIPSIGSAKPKAITLDVFPGTADASATVYDDDGLTYAYEHDGYFKQTVTAQPDGDSVAISVRAKQGNYTPTFTTYVVKVHGRAAETVTVDGKPLTDADVTRGRDVYGPFTLVRVPAAQSNDVRLTLSGNATKTDAEAIELEDGAFSGETVDTTLPVSKEHKGYSGTGFASGFSRPHGAVAVSIRRHAAGTYAATLRVSNEVRRRDQDQTKTLGLYVNGVRVRTLELATTNSWDEWTEMPVDLPLSAGDNVVMLRRDPGDTGGVNADCWHVPLDPK